MKTKEEIEQLAESEYGTEIVSIRGSNPYDIEKDRKNGYIKGYTQCQEDMAEKTHTCYHPLPYRLAKSDVNYECTLCGKFI